MLLETASAIGASSMKDNKVTANEISNQLPSSSQPSSISATQATTITTDLANSSTSTNTPLPITTNSNDKANADSSNNQKSLSSASVTCSPTTTNTVLETVSNVNVGKKLGKNAISIYI